MRSDLKLWGAAVALIAGAYVHEATDLASTGVITMLVGFALGILWLLEQL